jgi:hypothetical protein
MKRASDGQLLTAVLAVPVGALLLISGVSALFGEPNTGETIAIGCAMILTLSSLFPQLAGVRFATNGPRSLQNLLGFLGAFFAMMLVGQMPDADQSLARAALGWFPLALVIALVGGRDFARQIKALRRHPRALRIWGRLAILVAILPLMLALQAWEGGASIAQGIWAWLVMGAIMFSFPIISPQKLGRISDVRRFILFIADVILLVALFYIIVFVQQIGAMAFEDDLPILIGAAIGAFIGFGFMALRHRFLANNPNET